MSIAKRVLSHFNVQDGAKWMASPNELLGGMSPNQALANGEFLKVNDLLDQMDKKRKKMI